MKRKQTRTRGLTWPMVQIGLTAGAAKELAEGVKSIIHMKASERVKIAAIKALKDGAMVGSASISNCTFLTGVKDRP